MNSDLHTIQPPTTAEAPSQVGREATGSAEARPTASTPGQRLDDLAQIMRAYNAVTENLQRSHESLQAEVVRLQEKLASTDAQLQRSRRLAALGEMAAGIAHEIRNPLGAIQLYADLIVDDLTKAMGTTVTPGPETPRAETAETARKIVAAVRGLNAIVCDVLAFARDLAPSPKIVEITEIFNRAVDAHRPAIAAAGVVVERSDRHSDGNATPLLIRADPDLIYQAVLNLVRNAVEAMEELKIPGACARGKDAKPQAGKRRTKGATGARLTLDARRDGSMAVLAVRDTGPGIAAENVDRIFNPFFTTRNTGTGLGLAIVHRIVDVHGGSIAVHNDHGAVFEIRLPAVEQASSTINGVASRSLDSGHGSEHVAA